jgi:hypothetical protein
MKLRTGGGAVMPHALITRKPVVRAEADPLATNLVRFCAVHTELGVNSDNDRTHHRQRASPHHSSKETLDRVPIRPARAR